MNVMGMLDLGELVKRAVKYIVEGIMVALAAYAIPKKSLNVDEVLLCSSASLRSKHRSDDRLESRTPARLFSGVIRVDTEFLSLSVRP